MNQCSSLLLALATLSILFSLASATNCVHSASFGRNDRPVSVKLAVDDWYDIYQNGVALMGAEVRIGWTRSHTFRLDPRGGVLAVHGVNRRGPSAIMAEIKYSSGRVYNLAAKWYCSKHRPGITNTAWMTQVNYSNGRFKRARRLGTAARSRWRRRGAIRRMRSNSEWFWSSNWNRRWGQTWCRIVL